MATMTAAERKAKLEEAEKDLGFIEQPARQERWNDAKAREEGIRREAERKRLHEEYLRDKHRADREARAARLKLEEDEVAAAIDGNATVAYLRAEVETAQVEVDALHAKRGGVVAELTALEADAVSFEGIETDDLAAHAAAWQKKHAAGLAAARAAKGELERRIGLAEGRLAEVTADLYRAERVALHHTVDNLIEEIRGPLTQVNELMQRIRRHEGYISTRKGVRHVFGYARLATSVEGIVEHWDQEMETLRRYSEDYGDE